MIIFFPICFLIGCYIGTMIPRLTRPRSIQLYRLSHDVILPPPPTPDDTKLPRARVPTNVGCFST